MQAIIVGLLSVCFATNTLAVTQQSLTLPLTFEHETNPQFSVTNEQSINRVILVPNYSLTVNQDTEQWLAQVSFRLERSSDQTISEDRNDPTLNLGWKHAYETGQFGVTALLNDQSTRVSEYAGIGQQVSRDNTQKNRSLSVNWLNTLSDRTSLTLTGVATNVTFDGLDTTGLVNYRNESVNAKLRYTLNEKIETFTQLSFSSFKPEDVNNLHSETKGFNLGLTWNVNEKFNMTVSAGTNETIIESNIQIASKNKSRQAMLSMQYATLRTNSQLSLSRDLSPSSTGSLNETNQLTAGWTYNLGERDNIALNIIWGQNLTLDKRETKSLSANYTRQISLSWDLRLSAAHRNIDDNLTSASSNSVMASIIYNLPDL